MKFDPFEHRALAEAAGFSVQKGRFQTSLGTHRFAAVDPQGEIYAVGDTADEVWRAFLTLRWFPHFAAEQRTLIAEALRRDHPGIPVDDGSDRSLADHPAVAKIAARLRVELGYTKRCQARKVR